MAFNLSLMQTRFLEKEFKYDGTQLRSLFGYLNCGILGDSIIAWVGACDIAFEHMLDGEDLRSQSAIRGDKMLHFIVEKFDVSLFAAVSLQRLLAAMAQNILGSMTDITLRRDGDDLYANTKKLSISIATCSPTSTLIHFAVNVVNSGTPVETISLQELKVNPAQFAKNLMTAFSDEVQTIEQAVRKVRPTGSF